MQRFEVTFTLYDQFEAGKAAKANSLNANQRTVVEAFDIARARALVQAQYGKTCVIHGCRPLS